MTKASKGPCATITPPDKPRQINCLTQTAQGQKSEVRDQKSKKTEIRIPKSEEDRGQKSEVRDYGYDYG